MIRRPPRPTLFPYATLFRSASSPAATRSTPSAYRPTPRPGAVPGRAEPLPVSPAGGIRPPRRVHPACCRPRPVPAPPVRRRGVGRDSGGMTDPQETGRRTADELVRRLAADDGAGADELLAGLPEVRDLVFVGAGLTAIARADGRQLPPAQRAQASTRQDRQSVVQG